MVERYPTVVSFPSEVGDRIAQTWDWMQLQGLTGGLPAGLPRLWAAVSHPRPEAQKILAAAHLETLFSDPVLGGTIFKDPINGFEPYSQDKDGVLLMIGECGLEGYVRFLVSAVNQQWSHVWMVETLRVQRGLTLDEEETRLHYESARTIRQFLSLIGESRLVHRRFRAGWIAKVRGHDLDAVRLTVNTALRRAHFSANFTLGASPQSLSKP